MKKLLLFLALLPVVALAGTATATWTHPTTYVDGKPLPLSEITSTRVEWENYAVGGGFGTKTGEIVVPAPPATATINNLPPGTFCFRSWTLATNGLESINPSGTWSKGVPAPASPPNPPTFVTISVVADANVAPAYKIMADGTRSATLAGFVPTGKACSGPVAFYYRGVPFRQVAASDVQWWGTTATTQVAASCG